MIGPCVMAMKAAGHFHVPPDHACLDDAMSHHQFHLPTVHSLQICVQIALRSRIKILRSTVLSLASLAESVIAERKSVVEILVEDGRRHIFL